MLLNYFRLAIRLLHRNPFFTSLNIIGLSVGFAVFFVLWQYSGNELSSDQYHNGAERIVRVGVDWRWTDDGKNSGRLLFGTGPSGVVHQIAHDFADVEDYVRIAHQSAFSDEFVGHGANVIVSGVNGKGKPFIFKEDRICYADPNLFNFFSIPLISGTPERVLSEANSVVLSSSAALRYFGNDDPVGQLLICNNQKTLKITGVFADLPENTHLKFDLAVSNVSYETTWNSALMAGTHSYLKLRDTDFVATAKKFNEKMPVYWSTVFKDLPHVQADLLLQPLTDISFNKSFTGDNFKHKSKPVLIALGAVGVAILIMAWINYINLAISRTDRRLKEVATRKITGAIDLDIGLQFTIEALVTNVIAVLLALTVIQFIRQPSEMFLQIHISGMDKVPLGTYAFFFAVVITGIFITGIYPAAISIRNTRRSMLSLYSRTSKRFVPALLSSSQYVVAVVLIFMALIIHKQLGFIITKDRGFSKDNVLMVDAPVIKSENYSADLNTLRNKIDATPDVERVTLQSGFINLGLRNTSKGIHINVDGYGTDENFIPLFRIPLLAGRNFLPDDRGDAVILSRLAMERLNFKEPGEAIGQRITAGPNDTGWVDLEIIGVTENIKTNAFYAYPDNTEAETGRGVAYVYSNKAFRAYVPQMILVQLVHDHHESSIKSIERDFTEIFPGNVCTASFVDQNLSGVYSDEGIIRNQLTFFSVLAIGIACLGLLGMMTNKIVEKQKEIAIRKTMGAGIGSLSKLMLSNAMVHVLVSFAVGIPIGNHLCKLYLERFSERVPITWWYYVIPLMVMIGILSVTIVFVANEIRKANPVDKLRNA